MAGVDPWDPEVRFTPSYLQSVFGSLPEIVPPQPTAQPSNLATADHGVQDQVNTRSVCSQCVTLPPGGQERHGTLESRQGGVTATASSIPPALNPVEELLRAVNAGNSQLEGVNTALNTLSHRLNDVEVLVSQQPQSVATQQQQPGGITSAVQQEHPDSGRSVSHQGERGVATQQQRPQDSPSEVQQVHPESVRPVPHPEDRGENQHTVSTEQHRQKTDTLEIITLPIGPKPGYKLHQKVVDMANSYFRGETYSLFRRGDNDLLQYAADVSAIQNGKDGLVDRESIARLVDRKLDCEEGIAIFKGKCKNGYLRDHFHLFLSECQAHYAILRLMAGISFVYGLVMRTTPYFPGAPPACEDIILNPDNYDFSDPPTLYNKVTQASGKCREVKLFARSSSIGRLPRKMTCKKM